MKLLLKILFGLSLAINVAVIFSMSYEDFNVLAITEDSSIRNFGLLHVNEDSAAVIEKGVFIPTYIHNLKSNSAGLEYSVPGTDFDFENWKKKRKARKAKRTVEKAVKKGMSASEVALYPYSAFENINLEVNSPPEGKIGVYVISNIGHVEAFYEFKSERGKKRKMSLDISRLDKGRYSVHCVSGGSRIIKQFKKV